MMCRKSVQIWAKNGQGRSKGLTFTLTDVRSCAFDLSAPQACERDNAI